MDWKNRIYCGELNLSMANRDVILMGWVDAIRDHGNILFIHLRDIRGMVQVVFDPQICMGGYNEALTLKEEDIIEVNGKVDLRDKGTENPYLDTGDVEVFATCLTIFSHAKSLPFKISEKAMVLDEEIQSSPVQIDEELRLEHRYLDLRRPSVQELFIKRYKIIKCIREYLDKYNFIEVETPFLTSSTPEGARDYLVPSRVHRGKFYALPQSPQLFKQLLMMGGMDRYFQIARCFRDEDLRPNRQPEFTQLDIEASFIDEEFIYELIEELTSRMFSIGGVKLKRPFERMTYSEAMDLYGTDRPDTRFAMTFCNITDVVRNSKYTIFNKIINKGGLIKGFCIKGHANALSKNVLQNEYALKIVPSFGARGMTWMKVIGGKLQSNIVQFFSPGEQLEIINSFKAEDGDVLMMIADTSLDLVNKSLCSLRLDVAKRLGMIPEDTFSPLWVTDFPLFELKDGKINSQHHPFTMPNRNNFDPEDIKDLLALNSRAYDLVMNGEELGGGSIRIHEMNIQEKVFNALGLSYDEAHAKFGFFLKALEYGAPPHAGLALGIDRVVAMILKTSSIRDVIAFPKNRRAFCPLTKAPSTVKEAQLRELGLDAKSVAARKPTGAVSAVLSDQEPHGVKPAEKLSKDEVRHVAKLAHLQLGDIEIGEYQNDLNAIFGYIEKLDTLNTENIQPSSHVLKMKNIWRDDKHPGPQNNDDLLANAPDREEDYFKVPKILD